MRALKIIIGVLLYVSGIAGALALFCLTFLLLSKGYQSYLLASIIVITLLTIILLYLANRVLKEDIQKLQRHFPKIFAMEIHQTGYQYAGFYKRVLAGLIDFLIFCPIWVIYRSINYSSLFEFAYLMLGWSLAEYLYEFILLSTKGQTVGKLIMKIKVCQKDGSSIGIKRSFLRTLVTLCIILAMFVLDIITASHTQNAGSSLTYTEIINIKIAAEGTFGSIVDSLLLIWFLSEFLTVLFNRKRRAIHDFIAGTIVLDLKSKSCETENNEKHSMVGETATDISNGADFLKNRETSIGLIK